MPFTLDDEMILYIIRGLPGSGKALPNNEPVLTPNGWRNIDTLSVEDDICAVDGTVTKITGVYPQGIKDVYKVTLDDGTYAFCTEDHLWSTKTEQEDEYIVRSTKDIIETIDKRHALPRIKPVCYNENTSISMEEMNNILHENKISSVPKKYFMCSAISRKYILKEILDNNNAFSSNSLEDVETVRDIVLSLGGKSIISKQDNIFSVHSSFSDVTRYIVSIEKAGKSECTCIKVAHESELFITRNYIPTHNTTLAKKLAPDTNYAADDYFIGKDGVYRFDKYKLDKAHQTCYKNVENAMMRGEPEIAVANTFTRKAEYENYVRLAEKMGYTVMEIICRSSFGSSHDVPEQTLNNMAKRFEM